jgi:hypothetical protein
MVLEALRLEVRIAAGGMVYRAGPDPRRDVVAFCGPQNAGCIMYGQFLGHYWLARGAGADEEVIDFTPGDWRRDRPPDAAIPGVAPIGHIRWMKNPPEYIWAPLRSLQPIPGHHTPNLGRAWYTGFRGTPPGLRDLAEKLGASAPITRYLTEEIRRHRLLERAGAIASA